MPGENTQSETTDLGTTQSETQSEAKTETQEATKPETQAEAKDDIIDFIKDTQKKQVESETEPESGTETDSTGSDVLPELADTGIPREFSDAAEAAGMTPEEIVKLGNRNTDEQLMELIPSLVDAVARLREPDKDDETKEKDTKKETQDEKTKTEQEKIEQEVAERIEKQLAEKYGTSLEEIKQLKADRESEKAYRNFDFAMKKIDELSKEFPVLGKIEELPKFESGALKGQVIPTHPAVKARMELVGYADAFIGRGQTIEDAMDNAIATYKGKHLTKELERSLIKDLKNHESNLSGPRTSKVTRKTYASSREEMEDEIRQLQRAAGVDV